MGQRKYDGECNIEKENVLIRIENGWRTNLQILEGSSSYVQSKGPTRTQEIERKICFGNFGRQLHHAGRIFPRGFDLTVKLGRGGKVAGGGE